MTNTFRSIRRSMDACRCIVVMLRYKFELTPSVKQVRRMSASCKYLQDASVRRSLRYTDGVRHSFMHIVG